MRTRFTSVTLLGAIFTLCLSPVPSTGQTDSALKLTTSSPQVTTDFRAGVRDWENLSTESAAEHFAAVYKADPAFGLGHVMYAFTAANLTPAQQRVELDRGVADAARASTNELVLAAAYRELALGNNATATTLFRAAAELMPSDRYAGFGAVGLFPAGTSQLSGLKEFVARNPDYGPPYNTLAYLLWQNGDKAGALAAAKRQVELNPNVPNPHDTYAEILQWNGNFAEAAAEYRRAATLTPRFPEAHAGLAELAALRGNYEEARSHLREAIANAWSPQQKLGYARQIAGTYALEGGTTDVNVRQLQAIADEAKALNDNQTAAGAYAQMAPVYANAGNATAAHQAIATAKSTLTPVPWFVDYYAGIAHALLKHWGPANEELATIKSLAKTDRTVPVDAAAALEGYIATQQGHPADALKILMASDTTSLLVMNRIAEAHAALGHSAEAANWNSRVTNNYALNLQDTRGVNSRRRARIEAAATAGKR
ncbi:MAG: tetratricopeptide repeat protein [Gemmatimonadaceae bacterium]